LAVNVPARERWWCRAARHRRSEAGKEVEATVEAVRAQGVAKGMSLASTRTVAGEKRLVECA
jgi:hypothetical protein